MRPSLTVLAALALLAGAAAPAPSWAAPSPERRALDAQPDPDSPYARDVHAEAVLGRIGLAVAHVRRGLEEARSRRDVVKTLCHDDKLQKLAGVEAHARARRAELRDAVPDDTAASDAAWAALTALEAEARKIEQEAQQCVGQQLYAFEAGQLSSAPAVRHWRVGDLASVFRARSAVAQQQPYVAAAGGKPSPPPPAGPQGASTGGASPPVAAPAASPLQRESAHDASMLLRSAQLTLAVYEVDEKMDAVEAAARAVGGYLALRGDREVSVRVPRERFDEALKAIEKLGDVLHKSIAAEDVTDQYVDLSLRLDNARAVRARLEKLLETATVRDAVEIQKELAKVTEEIERLEGKLKLLRDRIAFSVVTVTFERTQPQQVKTQEALLPFPWMRVIGLGPLLHVNR